MTQIAKAGSQPNVTIYNSAGEKVCGLPLGRVVEDVQVVTNLNFEEQGISDIVLKGIMFEFGGFDSTAFYYCSLSDVATFGCFISDAIFDTCKFIDITLISTEAFAVRFMNTTFKNVIFEGVNFTEAVFENCKFENCIFTCDNIGIATDLSDVKFVNCVLIESQFIDVEVNENTHLPPGARIKKSQEINRVVAKKLKNE